MATSSEITNAYLEQLLTQIQDPTVTADTLSNLLSQYQTITQLIRDGYQFSDAELADLPTTLRNELQVEIDSYISNNPILDRYNSRSAPVTRFADADLFLDTGFFILDGSLNFPYPGIFYAIVINHTNDYVFQILLGLREDRSFSRRKVDGLWSPYVEYSILI